MHYNHAQVGGIIHIKLGAPGTSDGFTITNLVTGGSQYLHHSSYQRLMYPMLTSASHKSFRCPIFPVVALICIGVGCWVTYIVRWRGHGVDRVRGVGSIIIIQSHPLSALGALEGLGR